jgi:CheY-like chemotaxis protein
LVPSYADWIFAKLRDQQWLTTMQGIDMNHTATATPSAPRSKLALVVDDDSFSQELFSEMLTALGVGDIRTAGTGRIALSTLASMPRPPDVLICDVFMPDMDGIEFLAELAKNGYQGGILLVSGLDVTMMAIAQEVALADGLKLLGAHSKPVPQSVLAQALLQADASTETATN